MNIRYSKILLEYPDDWQSFFEAILSFTNLPSDTVIKDWIKTKSNDEIVELFEDIKSDSSIKDSWQCRYRLYTMASGDLACNKCATSPGNTLDDVLSMNGCDDRTAAKMRDLIGVELNSRLKLFVQRIVVAVKSGEGGLFVIIGSDKTGKTSALERISNKCNKIKIDSTSLDYVQQSQRAKKLFVPSLMFIDDLGYELNMGLDPKLLVSLKTKDFKSTMVVTCNDLSEIGKITAYMEPKIMYIPEYTQDEIINILASLKYYKYFSVDKESCKYVVNMLNSVMDPNILNTAIEMINYMLLLGTEEKGVQDTINSFDRRIVSKALLVCTGKSINLDYNDVMNVLKDRICEFIKGQDEVIDEILPVLANIQTGLSDPSKPSGVVMAVGPTGIGKTELGKVIADVLYQGRLFKEDMNTYFEKHMVSKLIGSPPGYTGSQDVPALLSFVQTHKSGVILLDEIEKAHPSVRDTIMEMIDTGYMRDACGRLYDFRGFFIFMTSNAGFDDFSKGKGKGIGFGGDSKKVEVSKDKLYDSGHFSKSFLARTTVLFFKELEIDSIEEIAYRLIDELTSRLESIGLAVEQIILEDMANIVDTTVSKFDKDSGARSMRLYVEHELKNEILEKLKLTIKTEKQNAKTFQV